MNPPASSREDIAIIGFAGRFPGARNPEEFWRNLRDGVESVTFFPDAELEPSPLDGPLPAGDPQIVKARALLLQPEWFDAAFFGINPREAELMDPQHRLLLECAWEALEHAAIVPDTYPGSIGVFAGASLNTYLLANVLPQAAALRRAGGFQALLASDKDFLTTRISYKLNLRGPSLNVQTACSTSLVAVCLACQQLLGYQCDVALAGGVAVSFPQKKGLRHQEGGIVAPDGHCRPFDAAAAGTVPGDGAGLVVLKRLSESLADGDPVCAVIRGGAINNDGALKVGYTAPGVDGQAEVIALAQAQAEVAPETISYIETHGTGTPLGDPIEIAGLTQAFAASTRATGFCALGATKANIGHLDTAAGVAGLIKTVLALQHRQLPPVLHFRRPNPKIDFAATPFYVNDRLRDWTVNGHPRRAGVSSFGIGGTNAHVVLEEAPAVPPAVPARAWQLLVWSAKSPTALEAATANLALHLESQPDLNLAEVAWTLQTGRKHWAHRRALVCRDTADAIAALRAAEPRRILTGLVGETESPVIFLFSGQGVQHVGMTRGLYETEPDFRADVDRCCEMLQPHLGLDLRTILHPDGDGIETAAGQLNQTAFTQPALFVVEYALARWWISRGVRPQGMIGHSLGEFVAACLAGVFTLEDALALVAMRGRLIQQQAPGAMLAVRLPEADVLRLLEPPLSLAAVNAPEVCVVSGPAEAVGELETRLGADGTACRGVATSHAFHSAMMDPVCGPFAAELRRVKLTPPQIPFLSNVSGRWITDAEATDPDYWVAHLRQTVRFADGLGTLLREQRPILLEVGPGRTLGQLVRQHPLAGSARAVVASLGHPSDASGERPALLDALGRLWLAGTAVHWTALHPAPRRRVPLPTYPFERQRCWLEPAGDTTAGANPPWNVLLPPAARKETIVPPGPQPEATASAPAAGELAGRLRLIFQELSGVDLTGAAAGMSFHELGFDSLFLTQASLAVQREWGAEVTMRQLHEQFNSLEKLGAHLERLQPVASVPVVAPPPAPTESVPLTDAQREIWFAAQMGHGVSVAYNESCTLQLRGPLDLAALRQAAQQLVERHDALRVTLSPSGDTQRIGPPDPVELSLTDLAATKDAAGPDPLAGFIDAVAQEEFDLVRGPLWRLRLARLAGDHHALVLVAHHIICDGWSLHLLLYELGELYTARLLDEAVRLPPPGQLALYALQQAEQQQSPAFAAAEAYWLGQFSGGIPVLDLPADRARPASRTYAGAHQRRTLPPAIGAAVRRLALTHECTNFSVLLAAFATLLHRLSGQDDIVIGVPAAAQVLGGHENLVGHCVNLLPLRSQLADGAAGGEFLAAMRRLVLDAFEHWQHPFGRLLRRLNLPRDPNRVPLANVTFNLGRLHGKLRFGGTEATITSNPKRFVNFDLNFNVTEADGAFTLDCHYSTELFDAATIGRLLERYELLLGAIAANPQLPVRYLPLLTAEEHRQVTVEWHQTTTGYMQDLCLHELFEEQSWRTPDAIALVHGDERWTYRQLNQRANQIAHRLSRLGVGPETLVGVCTGRTPAMVAGLLGILKVGGAYLPLDPAYPAERLAFMLQDANVRVVLADESRRGVLPATLPSEAVLCLRTDGPEKSGENTAADPAWRARLQNLAYVIYTSGSTGRPKGVAIEHRSSVALLHWAHSVYANAELRGVLAATSLSFDLSVFELFVPLTRGGKVILADNALQLPILPARDEVTLINTVPSAMAELLRVHGVPDSVQTINLAGEPLSVALVRQLYALPAVKKVYDLYGPTETTTYSTCALRTADGPATIGRPIANTQVYLLDRHLQPVPPGAPGEVFIGGAGLARGYLHRPELTEERFITLSPGGAPPARFFRTGDLARHGPDGRLEFLGRLDQQVKIRGYRIEPEEIAAVLAQHPAVRDCVVLAREDVPGDKRLAAYVVPAGEPKPAIADLRAALVRGLPEYMVPSAFVLLDRLPRTPNGKVDRHALPAPGSDRPDLPEACTAPRTTTEEVLAKIWCAVLGLRQVGVHDNFFDLGGHSLLVAQVLARVRQAFAVELSLRHAFEAPTIAQLAAAVEDALVAEIKSLTDAEATRLVAQGAPLSTV